MQGDINYILQEEIPLFTVLFIDDVAVKGPATHYENADDTYETIPQNSGIRCFIWECKGNPNSMREQLSLNTNQGESKADLLLFSARLQM
jgi:hypothetical protein